MVTGTFVGADKELITAEFGKMMGSPSILLLFMLITMFITVTVCQADAAAHPEVSSILFHLCM